MAITGTLLSQHVSVNSARLSCVFASFVWRGVEHELVLIGKIKSCCRKGQHSLKFIMAVMVLKQRESILVKFLSFDLILC